MPVVLIAGAGITGASIAWHLARRGVRDIVVLDRGDAPGSGSTSRATGGFRAQFATPVEVRLSLLARRHLLAFEDETGVDPGYAPHGYLFLARTPAELEELRAAQQIQHACGLHEARLLDAHEVRETNPAIGDPSVAGGAFCPTDGFLRPMNLLRGSIAAAERLGVQFHFGREVRAWTREGDRIVAADTGHGRVEAELFIEARGAWAGSLVTPMRRCVAATRATHGLTEAMPMTIWAGDWFHLRVRDGRILLLWPDDPPDHHWLARVLRMAKERLPVLRDVEIDECWSGLYEMSPDGRALFGRSPQFENLWIATGSSGHGVMHAPAFGQLLAEWIVDGRPSIDVSELDPARFGA
jgi:sarcosine oxidase subunit beta